MPVSQHLLRTLQEALGAEAAGDLVTLVDAMDANRGDIRELRHEMQLGFAHIDARAEQMRTELLGVIEARHTETKGLISGGLAKMETLLERGLREQARFFFP